MVDIMKMVGKGEKKALPGHSNESGCAPGLWLPSSQESRPLLTHTPSRLVLVLHVRQIDTPRHSLVCVMARSTSSSGGVGGDTSSGPASG